MAVTGSEAQERLESLIEEVVDDAKAVEIISPVGRAYLVAADHFEAWRSLGEMSRVAFEHSAEPPN
ncbi:hypothetical protein DZF91_21280 [Actinomadura logoneensis]|uniref:Antitoxin n=1 Tax=Actinomadura logoneensis TaxID=2293572 RepID=A0A372JHY3_9ACTN|nr:hypothetical protein [Actinomadura logoneensis]RFU39635.1 hypothetical protein DZF91_21280 [Actinomadura logoneensis]